MRTLVIGDIHGAHKALLQAFQRAEFNYARDRLIVLGDVCDGYPEVRQCIDALLKVKNCDLVIGNHDLWALDWARRGNRPEIWTSQGGDRTIRSYNGGPMPPDHVDFLRKGHLWLEVNDQVFVHGGFDPEIPLTEHSSQTLVWDRELLAKAYQMHKRDPLYQFGHYADIFLGHTTTQLYKTLEPLKVCNVWDLDTGAGWSGKLTIMDIKTKKYWQSDLSPSLYGGNPDRMRKS